MSGYDDPILAALHGDAQAGPDARGLAQMGALLREHMQPPMAVDLRARVAAACAAISDEDEPEDALIDDIYDGGNHAAGAADPGLERLGTLVRQAATPDEPVDLLPRLEQRLASDGSESRRLAAELGRDTRWRVWTAVIGGHVAALFALAVVRLDLTPAPQSTGVYALSEPGATAHVHRLDLAALIEAAQGAEEARATTVSGWAYHAEEMTSLVRTRRDQSLRERTRELYRLSPSRPAVTAGLTWLAEQRLVLPTSTDAVTQGDLGEVASAACALLGEGLGDSRRQTAVEALLTQLAQPGVLASSTDPVAVALGALALSDAIQVLDDARWATPATAWLTQAIQLDEHTATSEAVLLLAAAQAEIAGCRLPEALVERLERIRRQPVESTSPALQAIGYLLRRANGVHEPEVARSLAAALPTPDGDGQLQPLTWFVVAVALREAEHGLWQSWSERLQDVLVSRARFRADGRAWLPADQVAGTDATATATAWMLMALQAGYRFVPLG